MDSLTAELITDVDRLGPVEADWRQLAEARCNAFITPEWFHGWWAFCGRSSKPLVAISRRPDGSVAGVMPLVLDESSRPRAVRFAGARLGDHFHAAAAKADEVEVARATMAAIESAGIDRKMILLEHVASDQDWWRQMQLASVTRRAVVEQQQTEVAYIPLSGLDWESYLASRSPNFRKQVRRAERILVRDHEMAIRPSTAATVEADLDTLFHLHDLRRDGLSASSLDADGRRALRSFAVAAQERGWLRLSVMEAEGAPISALLGWRLGAVFASYQGGFDPAWGRRSVGFSHEALAVRAAIEEGADEYDFLLGTESWKRRFTDEARDYQTTVLVRAGGPLQLLVAGEAAARRVSSGLARRHSLGRVVE